MALYGDLRPHSTSKDNRFLQFSDFRSPEAKHDYWMELQVFYRDYIVADMIKLMHYPVHMLSQGISKLREDLRMEHHRDLEKKTRPAKIDHKRAKDIRVLVIDPDDILKHYREPKSVGLQDTILVAIPGYSINDIKDVMARIKKDIGLEGIKAGRRSQRGLS